MSEIREQTRLDRILDIDGTKLYFADSGVGDPVLIRSGGHGLRDYLGALAADLAPYLRIIRLDPRGCGDSTPDGHYHDGVTVQDMERLRLHLKIDRWVVAGHSHGAHQALQYALTFPERTRGVIYIAGTGLQRDHSWSEAYRAARDRGGDRDVPMELFEWDPEVNQIASLSYAEFVRRPSLWKEISSFHTPFLAIMGERDIRPDWPVRQLVELLPNASWVTIPGAPHDLWYTHANELEQQILKFVATLP